MLRASAGSFGAPNNSRITARMMSRCHPVSPPIMRARPFVCGWAAASWRPPVPVWFWSGVRHHVDDVLAEEPARLLDLVNAHVEVDAAAVLAEAERRRQLIPLGADQQVQLAELTRVDPLLQLLQTRDEPAPVADLQREPAGG